MSSSKDNVFFNVAAGLLLMAAAAKLYSAGGSAYVLQVQDRLLHLGYRPLMVAAGLLEVAAAVFLLKCASGLRRALALLWLSANFAFYHLGHHLLGIHTCPC